MKHLVFLLLLALSGSTLIGSILGAVFQLDFGWWLLTVVGAVATAFTALYFIHLFSKKE